MCDARQKEKTAVSRLEALRKQLERSLGCLEGHARHMIRMADSHDHIELMDMSARAAMMHKIKTALSRIDAGNYGKCEDCGEAIAPARLEILPFATRCTPCQAIEDARIESLRSGKRVFRPFKEF
jgi:RNA polymerase-binding transcription factor DksA